MHGRPYPRYRDSGVEWLGEVPELWNVERSDTRVTTMKRQITPDLFSGVEVMHYSIPIVQELGTGAVENGEDIASAKQLIDGPVVLVSRLNPRKATICRASPHDSLLTLASTEFVALKPTSGDIRFLEYLVSSELFRQRLDSWVQSVTRSHQRARPEEIYRFWNAWPDYDEQRAIATFLDRETARIDTLIEKKRTLIERLKEKRSALISRTVTRGLPPEAAKAAGLNPHPRMKDSGVEWLGEVPEHWEVVPLRRIASLRSGENITAEELMEGGNFPVFGGNGVRGSFDGYTHEGEYVLIGRQGALCGNINYASGRFWASEHAVVVSPTREIAPLWLGELLREMKLNQYSLSAAQPGLSVDRILALKIPVPPLLEQEALAKFLSAVISRTARVAGAVEAAIERLSEYRSALITAAVTGKIDVREAAA